MTKITQLVTRNYCVGSFNDVRS